MACQFSQHCWTTGRVAPEDMVKCDTVGNVLGKFEALSSELSHLHVGQQRVEGSLQDLRDSLKVLLHRMPGEKIRLTKLSANADRLTEESNRSPWEESYRSPWEEPKAPGEEPKAGQLKTARVVPPGDLSPATSSCALGERPESKGSRKASSAGMSDVPWHVTNSKNRRHSRFQDRKSDSATDLSNVQGWRKRESVKSTARRMGPRQSERSVATERTEVKSVREKRHSTVSAAVAAVQSLEESHTVNFESPSDSCLLKLVRSSYFDNTMAFFIVLNAVVLGVQVQVMAEDELQDPPPMLFLVQSMLSLLFLLETTLRLIALKRKFFVGSTRLWNLFDLTIVSFSIAEFVLDILASNNTSSSFTLLRVLRVMRIIRVARIIRVFRFFRELRTMVYSILGSILSLFWAMTLLFVILFVVGIYITQSVTSYRVSSEANEELVLTLEGYFGNLFETIFHLLQAVTGGLNWGELARPLLHLDWFFAVFMSVFACFTLMALMNIVTGVFVTGAIYKAQNDKEAKIQDEMEEETRKIERLEEVFQELDEDCSGLLKLDEMEIICSDPRVMAHFRSMGLHVSTAYHLFRLLDLDNSDTVSISEFVMGCLRLQGVAKNVDVATLMYENKRMMGKWVAFMDYIEEQFTRLHQSIADAILGKAPAPARQDTTDVSEVVIQTAVEPTSQHSGSFTFLGNTTRASEVVGPGTASASKSNSTWRSKVVDKVPSSLNVYEKAETPSPAGNRESASNAIPQREVLWRSAVGRKTYENGLLAA